MFIMYSQAVALRIAPMRALHTSTHLAKIQPNNLKGRSSSSQKWLTRQLADPFVEKAKMENYRFQKYNLFKSIYSMAVCSHVDVGALSNFSKLTKRPSSLHLVKLFWIAAPLPDRGPKLPCRNQTLIVQCQINQKDL